MITAIAIGIAIFAIARLTAIPTNYSGWKYSFGNDSVYVGKCNDTNVAFVVIVNDMNHIVNLQPSIRPKTGLFGQVGDLELLATNKPAAHFALHSGRTVLIYIHEHIDVEVVKHLNDNAFVKSYTNLCTSGDSSALFRSLAEDRGH